MNSTHKISSALISVFDKEGLAPIIKKLDAFGVTLYSTGGTEKYIQELNRLTSFGYIENYLAEINISINNNLDFIYSDFPYADLWSSHPLTGLSPLFYYDEDMCPGLGPRSFPLLLSSKTPN
jgi:hypothetical protein